MTPDPIGSLAVAQGLFRGMGSDAELLGCRCEGCHTYYFPVRLSCCNPACTNKAVIEMPLSSRGTLYSYTIQCYRPPAMFRMEPWAPYAIGLVELPEGLRVMGLVRGLPLEEIAIDMAVQLSVEPLCTDEHGRQVLTYAFRPVDHLGRRA